MPGLLKIGQTSDFPEFRVRQLNTTGVPLPFVLEACFLVDQPDVVERIIHEKLTQYRQASNREFFLLAISEALEKITPIVIEATKRIADTDQPAAKQHDLPNDALYILQLLVSAGGQCGQPQWRLKEYTNLSDLDIEISIAHLVERKYAVRSRESANYSSIWLPTPKGIKFLADHQLVEEWMRR